MRPYARNEIRLLVYGRLRGTAVIAHSSNCCLFLLYLQRLRYLTHRPVTDDLLERAGRLFMINGVS